MDEGGVGRREEGVGFIRDLISMIKDRFNDMFTYGLKVLLFATAVSHVIKFLGATALDIIS
jgi:hypothetical protein